MAEFPISVLRPTHAVLSGQRRDVSIEIFLEPFTLGELDVETSIVMDGMDLPSVTAKGLAGKRFRFPVNPEDGYVDASIYIEHAHHPVDVTELSLESSPGGVLTGRFRTKICFSIEGLEDFDDVKFEFSVPIEVACGT